MPGSVTPRRWRSAPTCSSSWSASRPWRRPSGGPGGARPPRSVRRARHCAASREPPGAGSRAPCAHWARRLTSPPECCFGLAARSAGSGGRRAPRPGPAPAGGVGSERQLVGARGGAAPRPVVKVVPQENLAQWYVASADRILFAYRASALPGLHEFDWPKAEICLERAIQLGAGDDLTLAKLALTRGYATLERLNGAQYSETATAALRLKARDEFLLA